MLSRARSFAINVARRLIRLRHPAMTRPNLGTERKISLGKKIAPSVNHSTCTSSPAFVMSAIYDKSQEAIDQMKSLIGSSQDLPEYKLEKERYWIEEAYKFLRKNGIELACPGKSVPHGTGRTRSVVPKIWHVEPCCSNWSDVDY